MACTSCGQNARSTSTRATSGNAGGCADCGYQCPTLSNPPKCNELKDLATDMKDAIATNREFANGCSGASILSYVDSVVERQQCMIDQLILALCAKQDK